MQRAECRTVVLLISPDVLQVTHCLYGFLQNTEHIEYQITLPLQGTKYLLVLSPWSPRPISLIYSSYLPDLLILSPWSPRPISLIYSSFLPDLLVLSPWSTRPISLIYSSYLPDLLVLSPWQVVLHAAHILPHSMIGKMSRCWYISSTAYICAIWDYN